ncbi:MAG: sodium:proton antiporter [Halofilum sp. (in: g-proteobacteria)]|nr:sodium:proton antiporter [Halofilum sp. (in: g-proteobacteria)]
MELLDLAAAIVTLTAACAWLNHRFIGLPTTIGVMLIALGVSLALLLAGNTVLPGAADWARAALARLDFSRAVLDGMLAFLLFAGALFVDLDALAERRYVIGALASVGVIISTLVAGTLAWLAFAALGLDVGFAWCLVLGAVLAPSDPVAVLGILKGAGVPASLETKIVGESLFNDGVAVVVFLVLVEAAASGHVDPAGIGRLFLQEALGGALFGLALGWIAHHMLRTLDHYQVEILITLALVMGGYALAHALHLSGPIAMVVAGLLLGNHRRQRALSPGSARHLDHFWELVDELLNAVLFVLIGLELLLLPLGLTELLAGLVLIPVVLGARLAAVGLPVTLLRRFREFSPGVVRILTWGGLRGGISVALALSIPAGPARDIVLPATYCVVVFSLVAQGLTIGRVARALGADERA